MSNWQQALDNALRAAGLGYPVFPLSRNKIPAIPSPHDRGHACRGQCGQPGHGVHDATAVPDDVRLLFSHAPRAAGYGIACGGRLIGLDLDRKHGVDGVAELNRLAAEYGFAVPRTVTVCTPSKPGGFHLWLAAPEGVAVPNSAGRVGDGIDVRGTGGYLVGPGSMGKTGSYVFHPDLADVEVQPVPAALLRLMQPPAAPPVRPQPQLLRTRDAALDGLVRVVLRSQEGNRNSALYWAACQSWAHVNGGHLDASTAERALVDAAVSVGLGEADARRTFSSARRTAGVA